MDTGGLVARASTRGDSIYPAQSAIYVCVRHREGPDWINVLPVVRRAGPLVFLVEDNILYTLIGGSYGQCALQLAAGDRQSLIC